MSRDLKILIVDLNTADGSVFSGLVEGVELRTPDGMIAINSQEESYLNLTQMTHLTLRSGTEFLDFVLTNAAASLRTGTLTVLAEDIRAITSEPTPIASHNGDPKP